ncbi:MAG: hypothetical protein AAF353_03990 [Pseudomonadota bacterium]
MNTNRFWICMALMGASLFQPLAADQQTGYWQTVGEAYELNGDRLLYSEAHCVSENENSREVIYRDGEGHLIARKFVDYQTGNVTPSFVQHNILAGESLKVELQDRTLTMSVLDTESQPLKVTNAETSQTLPIVIDAGFDHFIQENWNELTVGQNKSFQFPLPARASLVNLRISPTTCSYDTDVDQCFRLDVDNWLLRMLVKPIELGYDAELRRLTRYRGLSNIEDDAGKGMTVDIRYQYQDEASQQCVVDHRVADGIDFQLARHADGVKVR